METYVVISMKKHDNNKVKIDQNNSTYPMFLTPSMVIK